MGFTKMPPDEIERRRQKSVRAWADIQRAEWEVRYQEMLDTLYWRKGRCCAGCDHWQSEGGMTGQCMAAPIVSGLDVMKSMGIDWSSYKFEPGHPYRHAEHVCGAFKDDFDWSTLPPEYLARIGAKV